LLLLRSKDDPRKQTNHLIHCALKGPNDSPLTGITSLCAAVAGLAKGVLRKEPGKAEDILTYNATMELDPDGLKKTLEKLVDEHHMVRIRTPTKQTTPHLDQANETLCEQNRTGPIDRGLHWQEEGQR